MNARLFSKSILMVASLLLLLGSYQFFSASNYEKGRLNARAADAIDAVNGIYGHNVRDLDESINKAKELRNYFLLASAITFIIGFGLKTASTEKSIYPTRKCPYCAEDIKTDAVICRFCKSDIPPYN